MWMKVCHLLSNKDGMNEISRPDEMSQYLELPRKTQNHKVAQFLTINVSYLRYSPYRINFTGIL